MHHPVLLSEILEYLNPNQGLYTGFYLDATFGRGGHSRAILERLGPEAGLYACDRDAAAAESAESLMRRMTLNSSNTKFNFYKTAFSGIFDFLKEQEVFGELSGLLLDLGVSSPQLDDPRRGFSFRHNGPLDMRMDQSTGTSAAEWLATVEAETLAQVLKTYGEEKFSKKIAAAIVETRLEQPLLETATLAALVARVIPKKFHEKNKHPATRTFQAIRIYLNRELDELEKFLNLSHNALKRGGRLLVVSFHSLEDRMVKNFIQEGSRPKLKTLPWEPEMPEPKWLKISQKPIFPTETEIKINPRARSAVLRVAEKL
ncbi:MAG: 16S rRNA (cytosine(1402)-N(4))-methyltransferase RsmH [Gammaproteobacteria bacterium]